MSTGSSFGADVYGGAISALFIGAYAWSVGLNGQTAKVGATFVQDSDVVLTSSMFENCVALSFTSGSGSKDSSAVFGGAVAIAQSPQFVPNLADSSASNNTGFNMTVLIFSSKFFNCLASTFSSDVSPNSARGGGGAVSAKSPALSNLTVRHVTFNSCCVQVLSGTIEQAQIPVVLPPSWAARSTNSADAVTPISAGGALAVEASGSGFTAVEIASISFFNCSAQGANAGNLAVRGGAVAVARAASVVAKNCNFIKCEISDAVRSNSISGIVSGGAGMIAVLVRNVDLYNCSFDATNSRDSSESSTGLLVLSSALTSTRLHVEKSAFVSNAAVFRYKCVNEGGIRAAMCASSDTAFIHVFDSSIRQLQQQNAPFVSEVPLMAFGNAVPSLFSRFSVTCLIDSIHRLQEVV